MTPYSQRPSLTSPQPRSTAGARRWRIAGARAGVTALTVLAVAACGGDPPREAALPPIGLSFSPHEIIARFTDRAPEDLRNRVAGRDLTLRCRFRAPAQRLTALPLYWREQFGDWGLAPDVDGHWPLTQPPLGTLVERCDILYPYEHAVVSRVAHPKQTD